MSPIRGESRRPEIPSNVRCRELIRRLIIEGPDALALQIYRRLDVDRMKCRPLAPGGPPTWPEIAEWAEREGLMDPAEARLLGGIWWPESEDGNETPA